MLAPRSGADKFSGISVWLGPRITHVRSSSDPRSIDLAMLANLGADSAILGGYLCRTTANLVRVRSLLAQLGQFGASSVNSGAMTIFVSLSFLVPAQLVTPKMRLRPQGRENANPALFEISSRLRSKSGPSPDRPPDTDPRVKLSGKMGNCGMQSAPRQVGSKAASSKSDP